MRVVSGKYRGLKLFSPEDKAIRPTTDRLKETLFNVISPYISECNFLDLFAGSGAIGIEAASRGAKSVTFVEQDKQAFELLSKNVKLAKGLIENVSLINDSVENVLLLLSKKSKQFDVVFLDPPYYKGYEETILQLVCELNIIADDGIIIVEQGAETAMIELGGLTCFKQKHFKTTSFIFYRR